MSRQATVIAADEATLSLSGKMNIFGIYTTDIQILSDPTVANQLVFVFMIETDPAEPFQQLMVRVELPGGDTRQQILAPQTFTEGRADTIRWSVKFPLLFQNPVLRPGPIVAQVIHEKGVLSPAAPFVVLKAEAPSAAPATH